MENPPPPPPRQEYMRKYRLENIDKEKERRRIEVRRSTHELWNEKRTVLGMRSNDDFASMLLKTYEDHKGCSTTGQMNLDGTEMGTRIPMLTSTPRRPKDPSTSEHDKTRIPMITSTPRKDPSTSEHDKREEGPIIPSSFGCTEPLPLEQDDLLEPPSPIMGIASMELAASVERPTYEEQLDDSCQNLDISVNYTVKGDFVYPCETMSEVDESEYSEAEPNFQIGPSCDELPRIGALEEVMGVEPEEEHDEEEEETGEEEGEEEGAQKDWGTTKSGLHQKISVSDAEESAFFVISKSRLLNLARRAGGTCRRCRKEVEPLVKQCRGSAAKVTWSCPEGHTASWCSQELLHNSHVGDVKMASATLFSGNNFRKIELMWKFMKLSVMGENTYYALQRRYLCPAVEEHWKDVQEATVAKHSQHPVVLCGDGRNDSPGHCAQYLTYTFIEHDSKDVIHVGFKDKRETAMKSGSMEPVAFKEGLAEVEGKGVSVKEVVTDAHSSIAKFMREERPDVKHSWDIWHGAKNLGKRFSKVCGKAANRPLLFWISHILNHFWYCARTCDGNIQRLKAKWHGLTHHVTNRHTWISGMGDQAACEHEAITDDREEWLSAGGSPHRAMVEVAYDRRFIGNLDYYVNFRHTSMLESIHNHILMYSSKRFSFNYQAYRARNLLAMIDYMSHKDRAYVLDAEGNVKYVRVWSKHAANYVAKPVKVAKDYTYIRDLMRSVLTMREKDQVPLYSKAELLPTDPRHIRPRLAPYPAPPLNEILARRKGRLNPGVTARI